MSATTPATTTTETAPAPPTVRPGEVIYARLTGPCHDSGGYPWEEVRDAPRGAWETTGRTGGVADDPAYPVHPNAALDGVGRVFEMKRFARTGELRFHDGAGYIL